MSEVYISISIDTECDHDSNWVRSNPLKFDSVLYGLHDSLQPIFIETGSIPTYLLTVEVLESDSCVSSLKSIKGKHELGTHLHAAFIEPSKVYQNYAGVESLDLQCDLDSDIEFEKLKNLTGLFKNKFDFDPLTFRAGRFGAGDNTIKSLIKLGYLVETSVVPGMFSKDGGGMIDYRKAMVRPYYVNEKILIPVERKNKDSLLEVPVTVRKRFIRSPKWFRPYFSSLECMKRIADYHIRKEAGSNVNLNMMFHSMEVTPGASPYTKTDDDVKKYLEDLHDILNWCGEQGFKFIKCCDLPSVFK